MDKKIKELLGEMCSSHTYMPVLAMEGLIQQGEKAVEPVIASYQRKPGYPEPYDELWHLVVLGEIKSPQAIPFLVDVLKNRGEEDFLALAAAEALAKIGEASIPHLIQFISDNPEVFGRLYAYYALGNIRAEDSYQFLLSALEEEREMVDVVAESLVDQGRAEAWQKIFEVYQKGTARYYPELEESIALLKLNMAAKRKREIERNWKIRYRRLPIMGGGISPGWVLVAAIAHREKGPSEKEVQSLKSLEEILEGEKKWLEELEKESKRRTDPSLMKLGEFTIYRTDFLPLMKFGVSILKAYSDQGYLTLYEVLDSLDEEEMTLRKRYSNLENLEGSLDYQMIEEINVARLLIFYLIEQGEAVLEEAIKTLNKLQISFH